MPSTSCSSKVPGFIQALLPMTTPLVCSGSNLVSGIGPSSWSQSLKHLSLGGTSQIQPRTQGYSLVTAGFSCIENHRVVYYSCKYWGFNVLKPISNLRSSSTGLRPLIVTVATCAGMHLGLSHCITMPCLCTSLMVIF